MTIQECYEALGGDYEEVIGRLMREKMVQKFLLKFLNDKSYDLLVESIEADNAEEAFRAAHTIKGVCQNLSFTKLYQSSELITEMLRAGDTAGAYAFLDNVTEDYEQTVKAIRALQASLPEEAQ